MSKKIAKLWLIFHVFVGIKAQQDSLLSKLVNRHSLSNQSIDKKYFIAETNGPGIDFACRYKHPSLKTPVMRSAAPTKPRFIDLERNNTEEVDEMEAPTGKLSVLNLLPDDENEEDDDSNDDEQMKTEEEDEDEEEKKGKEDEEQEEGEDYGINFFDDEDLDLDQLNGTKSESYLKQYHRQNIRMHHLVFPLLLAYKLKFFTVIPLLLGTLVLLVGTTGVAGFFFALFAAALGIRAKSHH